MEEPNEKLVHNHVISTINPYLAPHFGGIVRLKNRLVILVSTERNRVIPSELRR
jgi:hypothetical protein